jgi:hypothetical protein
MEFSPTIIIAVLLIVIVGAIIGWFFARRKHAARLKDRYGSDEYDQTVSALGNKNTAHAEMDSREKHVKGLKIQELTPEEREKYLGEWSEVQSKFVDEPGVAIVSAERLIQRVMRRRAYPVADFEQRASDLSVTYPVLVSNYRAAHKIAQKHEAGEANTEELREAMIHYRSLFDELLGPKVEDNG